MASGVGVNGGTGRCYPFWLEFSKCMAEADLPMDCKAFREDYVECLHHGKELKRRTAIAAELNRRRLKEIAEREAAAKQKPK